MSKVGLYESTQKRNFDKTIALDSSFLIRLEFLMAREDGKIKVNGAPSGSPEPITGCGGVFRNCHGFVMGCFAMLLDVLYAFEAELLMVVYAISYAWEQFLKSLMVGKKGTILSSTKAVGSFKMQFGGV
ncbi:hypothetical protein TorRG33x02_242910 [Trema orientale]|uniref:RNase H type-1 domain-containing protein n=1 Tax=Trema orientale TaxID=63057 RepID=A0A2P5DSU5_TREOI|nr:hypothetical protein TorRG33x02_242910 [Trema orientale]